MNYRKINSAKNKIEINNININKRVIKWKRMKQKQINK